jgi:hypothetical protein
MYGVDQLLLVGGDAKQSPHTDPYGHCLGGECCRGTASKCGEFREGRASLRAFYRFRGRLLNVASRVEVSRPKSILAQMVTVRAIYGIWII